MWTYVYSYTVLSIFVEKYKKFVLFSIVADEIISFFFIRTNRVTRNKTSCSIFSISSTVNCYSTSTRRIIYVPIVAEFYITLFSLP